MTLPLLVCLPFWESDRNQCHDLCKLIAGMQQTPTKEVHFLFVARQDCQLDGNMKGIMERKFPVSFYHSQSPLRGWPAGPNGMFGRTMCEVATNMIQKFQAVYWMEADCVPMRRDWVKVLSDEWEKRRNGTFIVGCTHSVDGTEDGMHVNGNALYDQQIARLMPPITYSDVWAWDWEHRHKMMKAAQHTDYIINKYKATQLTDKEYESYKNLAIVHGYKNDSLIKRVAGEFNVV